MWLVGLGLVFLAMKVTGWGFAAEWGWPAVLSPFFGAMLWWWWADASGHTSRQAMRREQKRQSDRHARAVEDLRQSTFGRRHRRR